MPQTAEWTDFVSIPFKRESVSKEFIRDEKLDLIDEVSIPFKRESVSKESITFILTGYIKSFNSLQTGKRIQRSPVGVLNIISKLFQFPSNGKAYPKTTPPTVTEVGYYAFQFPSNGKAYPKWTTRPSQSSIIVSIPFKRESVSKDYY